LACIAASLAVLSAASLARAQETTLAPLKVLPLGDSITAGIVAGGLPGNGGYRAPLERLLAGHSRKVVLVGDRHDYSPGMLAPWHDGWPGYVIRETSPGAPGQLYGSLVRHAIVTTHPDVILLMIGTNDFLRYEATHGTYSVDEMVHSLDLLLDEIYEISPKVRVIVGAIVNSPKVNSCYVQRFDTGRDTCDGENHPSLAGLVKQYAAKGFAITYAGDMYDAVPRDRVHFPDGIHPANGANGYDAIAQAWYRAITESVALDQVKTSASRDDARAQDSSMAMRSPTDTSRPQR
jgi:lysophospholipase L1-like esterase